MLLKIDEFHMKLCSGIETLSGYSDRIYPIGHPIWYKIFYPKASIRIGSHPRIVL